MTTVTLGEKNNKLNRRKDVFMAKKKKAKKVSKK